MAKKGKRIKVMLVSEATGRSNYITHINKENTPKLRIRKYDPGTQKHERHVSKDKLK